MYKKAGEAFRKFLCTTQCTTADNSLRKKSEKVKDQYIVLAPRAFKRHVSEKDIT